MQIHRVDQESVQRSEHYVIVLTLDLLVTTVAFQVITNFTVNLTSKTDNDSLFEG